MFRFGFDDQDSVDEVGKEEDPRNSGNPKSTFEPFVIELVLFPHTQTQTQTYPQLQHTDGFANISVYSYMYIHIEFRSSSATTFPI